ncbi:MAG: hypothetical protein AAF502_21110 [Bacteroidota bacterium]
MRNKPGREQKSIITDSHIRIAKSMGLSPQLVAEVAKLFPRSQSKMVDALKAWQDQAPQYDFMSFYMTVYQAGK